MATADQNKDTLRRATQAFNQQDREAWDDCFADPCLFHLKSGDENLSHDDHWRAAQSWFHIFPDITATIESLFAEGDRVFVRWTYVGTHLGRTPSGVEPSGKTIDVGTLFAEYRFEDARAVEVWEMGRFVTKEDLEQA